MFQQLYRCGCCCGVTRLPLPVGVERQRAVAADIVFDVAVRQWAAAAADGEWQQLGHCWSSLIIAGAAVEEWLLLLLLVGVEGASQLPAACGTLLGRWAHGSSQTC
jgi:hypothetical protein